MTWVAPTARGRVQVRGSDTWTFLQSLVSADVESLGDGVSVASLLLTPKGKLGFAFRITRVGDDAWLDIAPGFEASLAETLARYRIRVDADLEVDSIEVLASRGALAGPEVSGERVVATDWPGVEGFDVLDPSSGTLERLRESGIEVVDETRFEAERIRAGAPAMGSELVEGVIPQEALLERHAVSFTKGCFIGQELVCRIDTRGHVNRFLRRLHLDGPVEVGAVVTHEDRDVGALTSVAMDGAHTIALAYVRAAVEPGSTVRVTSADGPVEARVDAI